MKVGLLFSHRNPAPWEIPCHQLYAETTEQVLFAEQLGFDGVFTTEHHFTEEGYSPAIMPIEAAWAARTQRVNIGSFVLLLCLQNPLRLAEDAATVDIISNGRLILGMGLGYRAEEFQGFGIPKKRSGRIMDEALEVLIRAWTEERFSFQGEFFNFQEVSMTPKPAQRPRPPIWVGRAGKAGVCRVARFDLEGFADAPNDENYQRYLQHCEEYGNKPKAQGQVLLFGHVHRDREAAWAEAEPHAAHIHREYRAWLWQHGDTRIFRNDLERDFIVGDPAHWRERLTEVIARRSGGLAPSYVIVQLQLAGMPHAQVMQSMELFAGEVLPHLRKSS